MNKKEQLENYRDILQLRARFAGIYLALMLFITLILSRFIAETPATGFVFGVIYGSQILILIICLRYMFALRNDSYLRKLYLKEKDERERYIRTRAKSAALPCMMIALLTAAMVAAFFNRAVFFTLVAVILISGLLVVLFKLYYAGRT